MLHENNNSLVEKYRAALAAGDAVGARKISEDILKANLGLVRRLAMRFARPQCDEDKDDAMQAGCMGVLRAIKDFDPKLGSFSTHAGNHIRDYVQRWTGKTVAVSRPRSATMPASIARAAAKFRLTRGTEPEASDLGVTEAQLIEWSSGTHFVALDDWDDEKPRTEVTYDEDEAEHSQQRMRVEAAWEAAMQELSPRNREIAEAVLMNGKTTVEVAAQHQLTHGRIVQVCKRIETRLRRAINPAHEPASDYEADARERFKRWYEAGGRERRAAARASGPPSSGAPRVGP